MPGLRLIEFDEEAGTNNIYVCRMSKAATATAAIAGGLVEVAARARTKTGTAAFSKWSTRV
jgi:hypothetical protein